MVLCIKHSQLSLKLSGYTFNQFDIRFLSEEAIPTTSHGAKQRAKDGYYACYRLTSERKQDEEFQTTINSEIVDLEDGDNKASSEQQDD